jgi:4-amino-4-deoxychorismate lyase
MSRFIETLRVEKGGIPLLAYHQARVQKAEAHFGFAAGIDWHHWEREARLWGQDRGIGKLRILYGKEESQGEIRPYRAMPIAVLHLVEASFWEYSHKYEDRAFLEKQTSRLAPQEEILLCKGTWIAECSFANIVFWNGSQWFTPEDVFLEGTRRQFLLDRGRVKVRRISVENLGDFSHWQLINAMRDLDEFPSQPITSIG